MSKQVRDVFSYLPHGFDIYLINVKTMRNIAKIFVAFSEKLNFNKKYKFIYSEKVTKFCEISTNYLSFVLPVK